MRYFELDNTHGVSLSDFDQPQLVITQQELKGLDVIGAPLLEEILLGPSEHVRHLAIQHAPKLSQISCTGDSLPLVVHLYADGFPDYLHIACPVEHLDVDWQTASIPNGQTQTYQTASKPWSSVTFIKSTSTHLEAVFENAGNDDLVLMEIDGKKPLEKMVIATKAHVILFNCTKVKTLSVQDVASLTVDRSDDTLSSIISSTQRLKVHECRLIKTIELPEYKDLTPLSINRGGYLEVSGHYARSLRIFGDLHAFRLKKSRTIDLEFSSCKKLVIHNCGVLMEIKGQFPDSLTLTGFVSNAMLRYSSEQFTESVMKYNLGSITSADDPALADLLERIPEQCQSRSISQALLILERAFMIGVPIEKIWELRCELSKRHLGRVGRWYWNLKGDGAMEAWDADFRLWAFALDHRIEDVKRLNKRLSGRIMKSIVQGKHGFRGLLSLLNKGQGTISTDTWERIFKHLNKTPMEDNARYIVSAPYPLMLRFARTAMKCFRDGADQSRVRLEVIRFFIYSASIAVVQEILGELLEFDRTATRICLLQRAQWIREKEQTHPWRGDTSDASCYVQMALGKAVPETKRVKIKIDDYEIWGVRLKRYSLTDKRWWPS